MKWKWVGKDKTDEAHAMTLARFLCGCIQTLDRGKDKFRFPLLEDLQVKARAFLVALQSIPPDTRKRKAKESTPTEKPSPTDAKPSSDPNPLARKDAILKLHEFLCSVVTDSIQTSQNDRFQCPVQAFITCFAYNDDDTFKVVTQVTGVHHHRRRRWWWAVTYLGL